MKAWIIDKLRAIGAVLVALVKVILCVILAGVLIEYRNGRPPTTDEHALFLACVALYFHFLRSR